MIKKILFVIVQIMVLFLFSGCKEENSSKIVFGVSGDYPPFEYYKDSKLTGFDIELAEMIAKELGKEAKFEDMQFSSILASIQNGSIDAGISTITVSEERKKNFDFSNSYYQESLSMVYQETLPIKDKGALVGKKIGCQLGTAMEMWLKNNAPEAKLILMNNNNQAIEALKAKHLDGVLMDSVQAMEFSEKNPGLNHSFLVKSDNGYAVAIRKGSKLKDEIDIAIETLKNKGELQKLEHKWLRNSK